MNEDDIAWIEEQAELMRRALWLIGVAGLGLVGLIGSLFV